MEFATWPQLCAARVLAVAPHAGHELRPEIEAATALDDATRRRDEDPFTDDLARACGCAVVVNRSRFEVDLNRERSEAVYLRPADAWGLRLWDEPLPDRSAERSRELHDRFYAQLGATLEALVAAHGGFVVYDVHSYNHRSDGPGSAPGPVIDNPLVNLGTGSLPERWAPVARAFTATMASCSFQGSAIDVRRNVRFEGRYLASFVNSRFGDVGCALAIEFKKTYMDEWTGEVDREALGELAAALQATIEPVEKAHRQCL